MGLDYENGLYPCNSANTSNIFPVSLDGTSAGTMNASSQSYIEPQYIRIAPQPNQALTVNRFLPLSAFKDTFVGENKNVCFATEMYLRFNTQIGSRIGFMTTNPANPNAVTPANSVLTTPVPQYNNVYLYLACEKNEQLCQSVQSQLNGSGIKMIIPYQYAYRYSSTAGSTTSNVNITLTQQYGHKLKRIITAPFNGVNSEQGLTSFDHSNVNGTKIQYLTSSWNSVPLTDYQVNCFDANSSVNPGNQWTFPNAAGTSGGSLPSDDYREARKYIVGSAISNYPVYQTNWFYQDSWGLNDMIKNANQTVDDANIDDGIDLLGSQHVYNIQFNTPYASNALNNYGGANGIIVYYLFAYFVRSLVIDRNGLHWV
jgi:hypothetical protein